MLGQRAEHQNAVDGVVRVQLVDGGEHLLLGCVLGEDKFLHLDADQLRALGRAALIGEVGGVLADAQNAEGRGDALGLEGIGAFGQFRV